MRLRLLPLIALAACERRDGYGPLPDPRVTVLDPGDGPENEAPLEPLRLGSWGEVGVKGHRVTGPIDAGRDALVAVEARSGGDLQGDTLGLLRRHRGDVVLHRLGAPLDPERPSGLWLPERVRVGMRWRSELEDGAWSGLGVTAREERMTPLGPVTAWAINELGEDEQPDPNTPYWYAEGLGPLEAPFSVGFEDERDRLRAWVVPEEDQPSEGLPLRPDPIRLVTDAFGQPLAPCRTDAWGNTTCSTVGSWTALIDGEPVLALAWSQTNPTTGASESFSFCHPLSRAGDMIQRGLDCRASLSELAVILGQRPFPASMPLQHLRLLRGLSPYAAHTWNEGGEARALVDTALGGSALGGRRLQLRRGAAVDDLAVCVAEPAACASVTDAALERGLYPGWSWDAESAGNTRAAATFGRWEVPPGEPVVFGVLAEDGRVFETRLVGERLEGWRFVGLLPGEVSMADGVDGPSMVAITRDLRVHRARVAGDRVVVEAMGDLPPVSFKDSLLSATLDPLDPRHLLFSVLQPEDIRGEPSLINGPLHEVRLSQEPLEVAAPATLGVGFGDWLGAAAVCALGAEGGVDPSTWTLRGEPVEAIVGGPGDRCALLRDDGPVDEAWLGAERAMSLDLPGIGALRLGYDPGAYAWDFGMPPQGMLAPTRDGGAVDVAGLLLDADGFPRAQSVNGFSASSLYQAWRDLSGDGLYVAPTSQTSPLRALASGTRTPDEPGWTWLGGVVGGGALLGIGDTWARYGAGEPVPVPEVQRYAVWDFLRTTPGWQSGYAGLLVALPDGDLCVARTPAVACAAPDGALRTIEQPYVSVGAVEGHSFWPLAGGDLLVLGTSGTIHRLDPATMGLSPYLEGYLSGLSTDAHGRVWATRSTPNSGPAHFVELTDDGPVEAFAVESGSFQAIPHARGWLTGEVDGWRLRWR